MSLREYIETRCVPVPFAGCWLWLLSIGSHGYGQASIPGARVTVAHRVSYEAFNGPIPPGMLVQHSCDNKWCVNPDHLSLGTDQTNSDDKHYKGRANLDRRVFSPRKDRKLTREQVLAIHQSNLSNAALGRMLNVDPVIVSNARAGRTYRELAPSPHHRPLRQLTREQIDAVNQLLRDSA